MPDPASSDRLMAGLMSGTSVDGIDVAFCRIMGSGRTIRIHREGFGYIPYSDELRERVLRVADPVHGSVFEAGTHSLTAEAKALDRELSHVYAEAIHTVAAGEGIDLAEVDAIGNHGQTVFHDPGASITVQLGNPAKLARLLGMTVVGDFRQADVFLGGQGAPLVPYMDWALFTDDIEHRVLLNLGGIANLTSLPAGSAKDAVRAFDTGPANMIVDALADRLLGDPMDMGGERALAGTPDAYVVSELLGHTWFQFPPPKSTGRELFGAEYIENFLSKTEHLETNDRLATAARLTSRSISEAIRRWVSGSPDRLLVSGGGVHNRAIMQGLEQDLPSMRVEPLSGLGFDPDAKEAVCFALLAHEALNGVATGMPSVTGARGHAFSGKICHPGKDD